MRNVRPRDAEGGDGPPSRASTGAAAADQSRLQLAHGGRVSTCANGIQVGLQRARSTTVSGVSRSSGPRGMRAAPNAISTLPTAVQ